MAEAYRIIDETGEWHVQARINKADDHEAALEINRMHDFVTRKIGAAANLKVVMLRSKSTLEIEAS